MVTCVDHFSKYGWVHPIRSKESSNVIFNLFLIKNRILTLLNFYNIFFKVVIALSSIVSTFGPPQILMTDQGSGQINF